ncbi:hypothetical protein HHK36_024374 [Tetracentron sinense]|uniref:Uncharacterized protein n=1 Tax=Tetracentron sinense TaxID=13715 RepID=A0A834YPN6_TETSI|nr:hypothetical protein HHK36_024374 [Tetracentron sinense]
MKLFQCKSCDSSLKVANYAFLFYVYKFGGFSRPNMFFFSFFFFFQITLTGFIFLVTSGLLGYIYSPRLDSAPPRWVHFAHGLLLFLYQTFDAVDGKQARRTNSSSPLGELFDHGCDALACAFETLAFGSTAMCGRSAFWFWVISAIPFYGATWEQVDDDGVDSLGSTTIRDYDMDYTPTTYTPKLIDVDLGEGGSRKDRSTCFFTNTLILPAVNGPTEGLMLIYMCHFFTSIVGAEWWVQHFGKSIPFLSWVPLVYEIPTYRIVLFLMTIFAVIPTVTFNVYNVYKVVQTRKGSMLLALAMLYPFIVLLGGVLAWDYLSPSDIMGNYPHLVIVGTGLAFGFLVGRMILAHLCDEPKGLKTGMCMSLLYLPFAIANALTARLNDGVPLVDESLVLLGYCAFTVALYLHFATSVIHEITTALGIYCFRKEINRRMSDQSHNISYKAGEAKGQTQAKTDQMMDKAGNAAQSAKESCQEAGQQMKAKAQGAADAVKDATGMNKPC